ncbi:hypothetical protein B0A48_17620 [Cryoendolithus antarcticus]|uniref:DNA2/NAM7 helicase-like C-terminal domain-containing protein n=1 Tax=Cryoendolithus antarcticus TaxID=1507870 RepID=A0A1V8SAX7_9PEZI|nr:hypothetical protein B0A48_17620 [Cryoendolithus antarcticus]
MATSMGYNEFFEVLTRSFFVVMKNSRMWDDCLVELDTQYRMHSQIAKPVSDIWYKGKLNNGPNTDDDTPEWLTMQKFLDTLRPAWNGRRIIAIDCSGSYSHCPGNGTSHVNDLEVDTLLRFADRAMKTVPPPGGVKLEPRHFLITTPYNATKWEIITKGGELGISQKGNRLDVQNTRAVQGGQGIFNLISFAKNKAGKPLSLGMVGDSHNLNVTLSRAMCLQVIFGNIAPWVQAVENQAPIVMRGGDLEYFGKVIESIHTNKDAIAMADLNSLMPIDEDAMAVEVKVPTFDAMIKTNEKGRAKKAKAATGVEKKSAFGRQEQGVRRR